MLDGQGGRDTEGSDIYRKDLNPSTSLSLADVSARESETLMPDKGNRQETCEFPTAAGIDDDALLGAQKRNKELTESQRSHGSRTSSKAAASFVAKTKFGVADVDEADDDIQEMVEGATPNTARRVI